MFQVGATGIEEEEKDEEDDIDIYALNGVRTHDPSVRASEDSSSLRPRGHCYRHLNYTQLVSCPQ
jgi:hypothetical protein